ncbi:putative lipoprotein [Burkholderia lata]|uniref:Putative lipoprotein n=1 Tax=Burkholderia lata (strain ATCC 17760 / DSM 23089 / LMG 22485 / NCIMB 9086 / R18194 / 383) TaxID=482957 RepID=A0A6P2UVY9_BURL3|nr:hypothetical protein [Burkholderia lata]VWC71562.1 putative lipoprotein [Burkholderia lata]
MKRLLPFASLAAALACALALSACAAQSSAPADASTQPPPAKPGSDRDAHGCIPSAGYSWCEATQQCEHPWELASQKGFANSAQAYNQFCRNGAAK